MSSLMESSKPSGKSLKNWNDNRPFFIDPALPGFVVSYGQFLEDLNRCVAAFALPELTLDPPTGRVNGECGTALPKLTLDSPTGRVNGEMASHFDCYRFLMGLIAALVDNRDVSLTELAGYSLPSQSLAQLTQLDRTNLLNAEGVAARVRVSSSRVTLYTSGTTGSAKPIVQSVTNLIRAVQVSCKHETDIWGLTYQPTKVAALQVILQAICNGNAIVNLYGLAPSEARNAIDTFEITHLSATPTYYRLLAIDPKPIPSVVAVSVGGEVCDANLQARMESIFPNARFRNIYASSETGTILQSTGDCFLVPESLRNAIRIRDGRLWIHQEHVAENLQHECVDGFWDSGDEVLIVSDEPLKLKISGRRSDWINVGGLKVNPHEVEQLINDVPGVVDARVYGIANSVTGHLVAADVYLAKSAPTSVTQPLDTASLRRHLSNRLPPHAVPRIVHFREELPISSSGKKDRHS